MYRIVVRRNAFSDSPTDYTIYSPSVADRGYVVFSPRLSEQINKASSLSFVCPDTNPNYDQITPFSGIVIVFDDDEIIFWGRVVSAERDFYRQKFVECEGVLAFLNDVILRPATISGTLSAYVADVLQKYRNVVPSDRFIQSGVFPSGNVAFERTNYVTALRELDDVRETNGFFFRIKIDVQGEVEQFPFLYIDSSLNQEGAQDVIFARNLTDLSDLTSAETFYSRMIPLGDSVDGETVTIKSVNGGNDWIEDASAVASQGRVEKVVQFQGITSPSDLLAAAQAKLAADVGNARTLTISAVDLHLLDSSVRRFEVGKLYHLISAPHGYTETGGNNVFPLTKSEIDLADPSRSVYTFGEVKKTLTGG